MRRAVLVTFTLGAALAVVGWISSATLAVLIGLGFVSVQWSAVAAIVAIVAMTLTVGALLERMEQRELRAFDLGKKAEIHRLN